MISNVYMIIDIWYSEILWGTTWYLVLWLPLGHSWSPVISGNIFTCQPCGTIVTDTIGAELRGRGFVTKLGRCGTGVTSGRSTVLKWEGHWSTAAGTATQYPSPGKILDMLNTRQWCWDLQHNKENIVFLTVPWVLGDRVMVMWQSVVHHDHCYTIANFIIFWNYLLMLICGHRACCIGYNMMINSH